MRTTYLGLALILCGAFYAALFVSGWHFGVKAGQQNSISVEHESPSLVYQAQSIPIFVPTRVYRFSLVQDGVRSLGQLQNLIDDPVLKKAYAGFDFASAHTCVVPQDEKSYVQFRVGNTVKWTKKRITLSAGTAGFCDKNGAFILERCGNFTSLTPRHPSENVDPSVLETPVEADSPLQPPLFLTAIESDQSFFPQLMPANPVDGPTPPPIIFFPSGGGGFIPLPPSPPTHTPEPSTLVLVASALFVVLVSCRVNERR